MIDDEDVHGIVAGLDDALAYVKGNQTRGCLANVDVKTAHEAMKLSRAKLTSTRRFHPGAVRDGL